MRAAHAGIVVPCGGGCVTRGAPFALVRPPVPVLGRPLVVLTLVAALLAAPVVPVRAAASDGAPESRIGVLLMVACGFALKAAIPAPVPWAGVAVMSCLFGLLDAAMSPDESAPPSDGKP